MTLLTNPNQQARWNAATTAALPVRVGLIRRVLGTGFEIAGLDAAIGDLVIVHTGDADLRGVVVARSGATVDFTDAWVDAR